LEESHSGFISTFLPTVHTNKLSIVHDWNIPGNKSLKNSIKMRIKDKLDLVIIFEKKKSSAIKLPIIKTNDETVILFRVPGLSADAIY
jgi:hypothetical protein